MKNILILGANSDIAKATAYEYAENGFNIELASRNSDRLNEFAQDLRVRFDVKVDIHEFDILFLKEHQEFIDGLERLPDGVVSAIGYLGDQANSEKNIDEFLLVNNTNYIAIAAFLNLIAHRFVNRGDGFIVGISSVAGDRGRSSNFIYGAAKAAFTSYLSGLRQSLTTKGVHVMTVKPGFVNTAMTKEMDLPNKLTAEPEQVAKHIYKSQIKGRSIIYTLPIWWVIMTIIKLIPEFIFRRLKL